MNDEDRLETIKQMHSLRIDLLNFDIDWLIEQAERKIETYRANTEWQEQHRIQEERALRFEQALKEILNLKYWEKRKVEDIANKALEAI